jgi:hypothetical protein
MSDGKSPHPAGSGDAGFHTPNSSADKITQFRSRFQGRGDTRGIECTMRQRLVPAPDRPAAELVPESGLGFRARNPPDVDLVAEVKWVF